MMEWSRLLCTALKKLLSFVVDDFGTVKFQIYASIFLWMCL